MREVIDETPRVRSLVLEVPDWPGHRAGQHVDVRLTAEDGYRAQRSYSIASPPAERRASTLTDRAHRGRGGLALSRRARCATAITSSCAGRSAVTSCGPPASGGPLFLVAGGSGVVPLMAMLRQRAAVDSNGSDDAAVFFAHGGGHHLPR